MNGSDPGKHAVQKFFKRAESDKVGVKKAWRGSNQS